MNEEYLRSKIREFDNEHRIMRIILIGDDDAIRQILFEEEMRE